MLHCCFNLVLCAESSTTSQRHTREWNPAKDSASRVTVNAVRLRWSSKWAVRAQRRFTPSSQVFSSAWQCSGDQQFQAGPHSSCCWQLCRLFGVWNSLKLSYHGDFLCFLLLCPSATWLWSHSVNHIKPSSYFSKKLTWMFVLNCECKSQNVKF